MKTPAFYADKQGYVHLACRFVFRM